MNRWVETPPDDGDAMRGIAFALLISFVIYAFAALVWWLA